MILVNASLRLVRPPTRKEPLRLYRDAIAYFEMFFGSDYLLQLLTSDGLHRFEQYLKNNRGLSQTTISIKMRNIHTVINYARRQKFVEFDIDPYLTMRILRLQKGNVPLLLKSFGPSVMLICQRKGLPC